MTGQEIYLTVVIFIALVLIVTERLRADLVALLVLLALGAGNIVSPQDALSGFSRSAVITVMGLFIITRGLDRTGVTRLLADSLWKVSAGSEVRLVFLFTVSGALLSLFTNTIAAGSGGLLVAFFVYRRPPLIPPTNIVFMSFLGVFVVTAQFVS